MNNDRNETRRQTTPTRLERLTPKRPRCPSKINKISSMCAFLVGDKLATFDSFRTQAKTLKWMGAIDCQGLQICEFDSNYLKTLDVNPDIFLISKTTPVAVEWSVVYLLAFYNGDAIKGEGKTSIWYSVNNNVPFAINSKHLRSSALTWFDCLSDRFAVHLKAFLKFITSKFTSGLAGISLQENADQVSLR